jgi:hypothetical protein
MDYDAGGVYQNAQNASKFVGYEYLDPDVESCGVWPFGYDCRDSDAAAFKYQGGVSFDWGYIVKPTGTPSQTWGSSGSLEISGTDFEIVAVGNANSWNDVDKVGRTTGWTRGDIVDTCEDLPGPGGVRRMCSMVTDFYSWGGDSGAPVFVVTSGSDVKLVGMYWGYDTEDSLSVFSSWNGLGDDSGSFSVFNPPLEVDIDGPSAVRPETECVWEAAILSGGTPPYTYAWSGVLSGSGSSDSGEVTSSGNLSLVVEDDEEETDGVLLYVTVSGGAPECEA